MKKLLKYFRFLLFILISLIGFVRPLALSAQEEQFNCAVTEYHIEGQARAGVVKKVFPSKDIVKHIRNHVVAQDSDSPEADILSTYSGIGETRVAILVVDDFTSLLPVPDDNITHGDYVKSFLDTLIGNLPTNSSGLNPASQIYVDTVNIADANFESGKIVDLISQHIDQLRDNYSHIILNMSIALVPCTPEIQEFLIQYRDSEGEEQGSLYEIPDLNISELLQEPYNSGNLETPFSSDSEEVQLAIRKVSNGSTYADAIQETANEFGIDPLRLVGPVYNADGKVQVIKVASAGNHGPGEPLYPAHWPEYIAVSAIDPDTSMLFSWSNNGEIEALGGHYDFSGIPKDGTSFSAPVISVKIAVSLTNGASCDDKPVSNPQVYDDSSSLTC